MGARGVNNEEAIAIADETFVSIFVYVFRTQWNLTCQNLRTTHIGFLTPLE